MSNRKGALIICNKVYAGGNFERQAYKYDLHKIICTLNISQQLDTKLKEITIIHDSTNFIVAIVLRE